jgi:4-diphosphocytidyl-2-C-methyl-D-erythritol kinase
MIVTCLPEGVLAQAPAKLNLFLEVLNRRDDGYHEIETLMVAITLFDTVFFSTTQEESLKLTCRSSVGPLACRQSQQAEAQRMSDVPEDHENLVVRAVERLRKAADVRAGATIELIKRIPARAGLGGASSDAAAALMAANLAWQLGWSRPDLARLSAGLGSDIPFFFGSGAAIGRGRGERIEDLAVPVALDVVVVRPPEGLSTADVYRNCSPCVERLRVEPLAAALTSGRRAEAAKLMTNRLQPVAETMTPWIARLRNAWDCFDCLGHQMSGSGTSYFGICRHAGHARRVAARLRNAGYGYVRVARTLTTAQHSPLAASQT